MSEQTTEADTPKVERRVSSLNDPEQVACLREFLKGAIALEEGTPEGKAIVTGIVVAALDLALDIRDGLMSVARSLDHMASPPLITSTKKRIHLTLPSDAGGEPDAAGQGVWLIASERLRQIVQEGYAPEDDSEYVEGELAAAAAAYAWSSTREPLSRRAIEAQDLWPPAWAGLNPKSPLRDLIRAGGLIAAEIDRRLAAGEAIDGR